MTDRYRMLPRLMAGLLLAAPIAMPAAAQTTQATATTKYRGTAVERRIADLHARLKITPSEQKPFDAFAQVMRDNGERMDDLVQKRQQTAATGTATDQMRSYTDMAQAHAEDMQHLTAAFSTLYDSLSADQKKLADQSFRQFAAARHGAAG